MGRAPHVRPRRNICGRLRIRADPARKTNLYELARFRYFRPVRHVPRSAPHCSRDFSVGSNPFFVGDGREEAPSLICQLPVSTRVCNQPAACLLVLTVDLSNHLAIPLLCYLVGYSQFARGRYRCHLGILRVLNYLLDRADHQIRIFLHDPMVTASCQYMIPKR